MPRRPDERSTLDFAATHYFAASSGSLVAEPCCAKSACTTSLSAHFSSLIRHMYQLATER